MPRPPRQRLPRPKRRRPKPPKAEAPKAEPRSADAPAACARSRAAANGHAAGDRTFASPLARRIAKDAGIDIAAVSGSGPHGRVVKADVEAAIAGGGAKAAPAAARPLPPQRRLPQPAPKPMSDEAVLKLFEQGSYELVPHDNMRKTIAAPAGRGEVRRSRIST